MLGSLTSMPVAELVQSLHSLWRTLQPHLSELSPEMRDQLKNFSMAFTGDMDRDNDQRTKSEVYGIIARFLRDRYKQPEGVCLTAVHRLCGEKEDAILRMADGPREDAPEAAAVGALEARLRNAVLLIKVHYEERAQFHTFTRRVEVYMDATDAGVDRAAFEQELPWASMPSDVRSQQIRNPQPAQIFVLYRQEAD
ncbi:MAG TPA: hypothetical protein VKK31_15005 [Thermoanaerobaculia bacterium]|nr:hypothetical protein [Thermoanaerobaculia bacterium]